MTQKVNIPSRFCIVRKPDEQGAIVARFETTANDPTEIPLEIPDSCVVVSVSDRSALMDANLDPSVLSEEEREVLGV